MVSFFIKRVLIALKETLVNDLKHIFFLNVVTLTRLDGFDHNLFLCLDGERCVHLTPIKFDKCCTLLL